MIGLKRGAVKLIVHQDEWNKNAEKIIEELKHCLGNTAIDIQHIGSTAISSIHAKPIIDIVVGIHNLNDIMPYIEVLRQNGFIFRGEDIPGQVLFVMGDFENDLRTCHIHVVIWNGNEWNDYINFRDYLNEFTQEAILYDDYKQKLAMQFSDERRHYTEGKQKLIKSLLEKARIWKSKQ